jgi:hypothetical protein
VEDLLRCGIRAATRLRGYVHGGTAVVRIWAGGSFFLIRRAGAPAGEEKKRRNLTAANKNDDDGLTDGMTQTDDSSVSKISYLALDAGLNRHRPVRYCFALCQDPHSICKSVKGRTMAGCSL